jgi:hypothetical protein
MKHLVLFCTFLLTFLALNAQENKEKLVKTGWNFGPLPAISYNTDIGFQYGGLVNFFNYGDGSIYPNYFHSIYVEISRTTKGSGINRLFYDSKHLIKGIRTTFDFCYLTEKALDFYGFNGYETKFNQDWIDDENKTDYRSRLFYRHERKIARLVTDFQGNIFDNKLRWVAGLSLSNTKIGSIDIDNINKGKDDADKLPSLDVMPGLYERYIEWGLLGNAEKNGGTVNLIKAGLVYDTRDFEANPMKGIWSEFVVVGAPSFLGNKEFSYAKFSITHRQYFTLVKDKLSFVYRLNYQGTIGGTVPFFMQTQRINSFINSYDYDGLGGAKSIRGMIRNRVVGDGIGFANAELRWKFFRFVAGKQNWYLALNTFLDGGKVVKRINIDQTKVPENIRSDYFDKSSDAMHYTAGGGFRVVMNENFIVACDYGRVLDKRDGSSGLYIGLNYLF